ncbi:LysM peptidoglycan-binding domain-containing protein [Phragmitibacter flavus]|nr:LysM peptidoglycan-binding domain-containing protein [Phragmitibacter flavus]
MEKILKQVVRAGAGLVIVVALASCSSGNKKKGLPTNLPNISLSSTSATPPHNMPSYAYPFDSSGTYVSAWAAEGERRSGRSGAANNSDVQRWTGSHGSSRTASRSSSSSKPRVTTTTKRKTTSSSGSRSHVVKKGDTLYGLARRYGSTVAKIKSASGLRSDLLRPGMTLRIPR